MSRRIDFCYDHLGANADLGYPNLAQTDLAPDTFDLTWPRVLPLRLLMYLQQFGFDFSTHQVKSAPVGAWYPIALAWHDFQCDYLELIPHDTKRRIKHNEIRLLFYYHEGDHPGRIKQRLDWLCDQHGLPKSCYLFVSANSSADRYRNFCYFNDHEYFFSYINRRQFPVPADSQSRPYEFTALNRIHKWWRAAVMSDLHHRGVLRRSLWSYNTLLTADDQPKDNPICMDSEPAWSSIMHNFLHQGPYVCDSRDTVAHNDHRTINTDLYIQSYCHLIIETLFDVDQSGGAFLTEKTWKCIKFGQPFVIIGPVGSLDVLRRSGYRVFDHAIDNTYDNIKDNTERYHAVRTVIQNIQQQDMHLWYLSCLDDVRHNQWHFQTKALGTLDNLVQRLTKDPHTV
jgi:hypothetical protein